jgi:hypothetical protein
MSQTGILPDFHPNPGSVSLVQPLDDPANQLLQWIMIGTWHKVVIVFLFGGF